MRYENKKYLLGTPPETWNEEVIDVTFIVTEGCNLRCKYCYITHKSESKIMDFQTAKEFIDLLFREKFDQKRKAIILDFIGGEPLLETKLIERIVEYFLKKAYLEKSTWFWNHRINICTNGVNYADKEVQRFIKRYQNKLSLSITIDGNKKKHDLQRVFKNGEGSYDAIINNVKLWIEQFGGTTKVTFASGDLAYLKDSIIELWNLGITSIAANVVFENVWKEGDDKVFEKQLIELADYAIENNLYDKYICSLFEDGIGGYYTSKEYYQTFCGAGKMIALGPNGNIYPCLRYKDYSLNNSSERVIGSIKTGIDYEKIRPFMVSAIKYQSDAKCLDCEVGNGCAFCQGFNYDDSLDETNFHRADYICKMHKARVRANDYYFSKLYNKTGIEREHFFSHNRNKFMIMESNNIVEFCQFNVKNSNNKIIKNDDILENLKYVRERNGIPILIHSKDVFIYQNKKEYLDYRIYHIFPYKFFDKVKSMKLKDVVFVVNDFEMKNLVDFDSTDVIFRINSANIQNLSELVLKLFSFTDRIYLKILDLNKNFDFKEYYNQLFLIKKLKGIGKWIDVLDDDEIYNCRAGKDSFTISPEGDIYGCPGEYYSEVKDKTKNISLLGKERLKNRFNYPICEVCNHKCKMCLFLNKQTTDEWNVPSSYSCYKSEVEYFVKNNLDLELEDPLTKWINKNVEDKVGYYFGDEKDKEKLCAK